VDTLVLVGHNPAFGSLAYELDNGDGERAARDALHSGFPTSAVAVSNPYCAVAFRAVPSAVSATSSSPRRRASSVS
jgi:hypothetical protein